MTPEELDEATVEEAKRRWLSTPALRICGKLDMDVPFIAARLAREGWKPPEPVDPDILAFREWTIARHPKCETEIKAGKWDHDFLAPPFLAGVRMAREQERERAKVPIRMAKDLAYRCRRLLHSLPAGVHDQLDVKWGIDAFSRAVEAEIAKYEEDGR